MFRKASVSNNSSPAVAESSFHSRAFDKRDVRETHNSRVWREELTETLEANLRHLDALRSLGRSTHASNASALRRL
jgi:hypothetical protein